MALSEFERKHLELLEAQVRATEANTAALATLRAAQPESGSGLKETAFYKEAKAVLASYNLRPGFPTQCARGTIAPKDDDGYEGAGFEYEVTATQQKPGEEYYVTHIAGVVPPARIAFVTADHVKTIGTEAVQLFNNTDPLKQASRAEMLRAAAPGIKHRIYETCYLHALRRLVSARPNAMVTLAQVKARSMTFELIAEPAADAEAAE